MHLQELLEKVSLVIKEAGAQMAATSVSPAHEKWGHYNFVTETDVSIQEFLRAKLAALLPESRFFAEEQENDALTNDYTWVVDPVDGTYNFIRCRYASCVSIGLLKDRVPVMGLVYQPYTRELFTAIKGGGAFLNGKQIHVTAQPFEKALVAIGTAPYYAELADATAYCFHQFLTKSGDIRRVGSAALDCCDLASGRADIFCELTLSPWDFAAGALLIQEAGGIFEMPYEPQIDFGKPACILAANPQCMDKAREIVLKAKEYIK